ncbi:MAG: RNA 2',3'-cyclic phosphodiesterase [Chloroflexi bacterium]|nr:RNA 2',3'-cyclic phosphodiesterase [Chloroflexota bacterium]
MNQIRAFIAIDLPPPIQESVEKQTAALRRTLGGGLVRWVPAHNMHLTLKFIGNVAASHVDFLKQMLVQSADSHTPFDLQVGGIGSFPNSKRPRVIWVGIHAPAELTSLQTNIEKGALRLGYEKEERPFSPHLTLGRVRQNLDAADVQKIRSALESTQIGRIGAARIDAVHLYQSDLRSDGSVYTKLFSAPLNKKEF